mmetsp:Transcript_28082/g.73637  ORF Transcript_28082/g.73637 Transcript_28082/m.73637 type:complete len:258 (-) Transcript_28082:51-824(-)
MNADDSSSSVMIAERISAHAVDTTSSSRPRSLGEPRRISNEGHRAFVKARTGCSSSGTGFFSSRRLHTRSSSRSAASKAASSGRRELSLSVAVTTTLKALAHSFSDSTRARSCVPAPMIEHIVSTNFLRLARVSTSSKRPRQGPSIASNASSSRCSAQCCDTCCNACKVGSTNSLISIACKRSATTCSRCSGWTLIHSEYSASVCSAAVRTCGWFGKCSRHSKNRGVNSSSSSRSDCAEPCSACKAASIARQPSSAP